MSSSLPWIIAVIAVGALLAMVVWRLRSPRSAPGPAPLPVDWDLLPRPVFTADERRLYRQLREALPHHVILAKLPLVRMCQPADPEKVLACTGPAADSSRRSGPRRAGDRQGGFG